VHSVGYLDDHAASELYPDTHWTSPTTRDRPAGQSAAAPAFVSITLPGPSRCTTPARCAASSAPAI
jgi:hypothetical protein